MVESFICSECRYTCYNKSNYNRHLQSLKHLNNLNNNLYNKKLICSCGKNFSSRQSLSRHKKKCLENDYKILNKDSIINKELVKDLVSLIKDQQNVFTSALLSALKDQSINLNTAITHMASSTGNYNNKLKNCENVKINSDNKYITFQFYLDNKCADAPSLPNFLMEKVRPLINKPPYSVNQIAVACAQKLKETEDILRPLQAIDGTLFVKVNNNEEEDKKWDETNKEKLDNKLANFSNEVVKEEHQKFEETYPNWNENETLQKKYIDFVKYYPGHNSPNSFSSDKSFQTLLKQSEVDKKLHLIK
jgi:hypothetical protein